MIFYINGRFLLESVTGVPRYAIAMVRAMDQLLDEKRYIFLFKVVLLVPNATKINLNLKNIEIKRIGILKNDLWEQIELPFYTGNGLLINLCNRAPLFKKNQILVIHDAAICVTPERFSIQFRLLWFGMYIVLGKILKTFITVSFFSKKEIHRHFCIPLDKLHVIYEGGEHIAKIKADSKILEKYKLQKGNFILSVGGSSNKNFLSIICALPYYEKQDLRIVIAGNVSKELQKKSQFQYEKNKVLFLGYVSDQELVSLYKNAGCFAFLSTYEGFGIPLLEAMAYGCPIVVSNRASIPEVCGDAAVYCDPYDTKDIAEKINLLLRDKSLAASMREKGEKQLKKFSWRKSAQQLLDIIWKCE